MLLEITRFVRPDPGTGFAVRGGVMRKICVLAFALLVLPGAASAASLSLMWDPSASTNVAGYVVSIREVGGAAQTVDVGPTTTWTFNNLPSGTTYVFAVRAYSDAGLHSPWSAEVTGTAMAAVRFVAAPGSVPAGELGSWSAAAAGVDGTPEYRFRRYSPATGWQVVRNYSTDPVYSWRPTSVDAGQYIIEVSTRSVGNPAPFEAQAITGYTAVGGALPMLTMPARVDFDGDGRSDFSVYRPSTGMWHALLSGAGYSTTLARGWGMSTDIPVPGDYDGDRRTDLAVFRPSTSTWYVLRSESGYTTTTVKAWGSLGDLPIPADFDGDGKTDFAVFRPATSTWYVLRSDGGYTTTIARTWGMLGDTPVPADYDGDGKTDFAVFRPSTSAWYALESSTGYTTAMARGWGMVGDRPIAADYDGDGRADLAVFRPTSGTWFILESTSRFTTAQARAWGNATDVPVPSDYFGRGRSEVAFFRPTSSSWWILNGPAMGWGMEGDVPLSMK